MAAWVVVDSGILLTIVLREPLTAQATALLRHWEQEEVLRAAPTLLIYEVAASSRKFVVQGRLTADEARRGLDFALAQPIRFMSDVALASRAYELATQLNLSTAYDAQYLAVAERLKCDFWTADQRLFNAVSSRLAWVKWIGDYAVEEKPG